MAYALNMERINTKQLTTELKAEMISLSKKVSKVREEYLLTRFEIYDQVICLRCNQRCLAFQLVQTFEHGEELFVYFGPLFSRMSCFLELFLNYLQMVMEENQNRKIHLLAEIENPEVLLFFKALFEDYAFPNFQGNQVPQKIKEKIRLYSEKLPHIQDLNAETMTTKSNETLYQERSIHSEMERWLYSREIDFSQGMNVVLYSYVATESNEREGFKRQLERGRNRMANWKEGKKEVLALLKGGIVSNV